MSRSIIRLGIVLVTCLVLFGVSRPAAAAPEGTMTWGVHITLRPAGSTPQRPRGSSRRSWCSTPCTTRCEAHAGGINTPSLAESWTQSKDGLTYEFVLRKGVKFHNGEPVTAEDVKFSFDRYRGAGAKLLKERVREVQIVDPGRVRFRPQGAVARLHDVLRHLGDRRRAGSCPRSTSRRSATTASRRRRSAPDPTGSSASTPASSSCWRPTRGTGARRRSSSGWSCAACPEETTRAAALKKGEVDIAYLLTGPVAEDIQRTPGFKLVAPKESRGVFWLDLPDQWDPKSPWHDRRVRQAASHAIDRQALNQAETLGFSKPTGVAHPARARVLAVVRARPPSIRRGPSSSWPRPATPTASTPATSIRGRPTSRWARRSPAICRRSASRPRIRTMERAAMTTAWREKKLKNVIVGITGAGGNAATRLEAYVSKERRSTPPASSPRSRTYSSVRRARST